MHDIISRDIGTGGDPDQQNDAVDVVVEAQLPRFQINIAGQDIVENHVLDKIAPVVLLIVILLDAGQRHRQQRRKFGGLLVGTLDKQDMLGTGTGPKRLIGIPTLDEKLLRREGLSRHGVGHFADSPKITAGDNGQRFIDHTDGPVDRFPHLMHDTLK